MKHTYKITLLSFVMLSTLTACDSLRNPTPQMDNRIRVVQQGGQSVAVAPTCASWTGDEANPFDNQPFPQYGCATARNLAMMVENPNDLIQGRNMGSARGVLAVGGIRRYDDNVTRGLIWTGTETNVVAVTTSSAPASNVKGNDVGGAKSAAPAAAAP